MYWLWLCKERTLPEIGASHSGWRSGWRWALSTHPFWLIPVQVSCQLSPCETAVSSDMEAQELTQSWSFNICVQFGHKASWVFLHRSASVGMQWRLGSLDVPWPLWLEFQLGSSHHFSSGGQSGLFLSFGTSCPFMTSLHFTPTAITSACKSMQSKACPSGVKVFKGMLLLWSKVV